MNEQGRNDDDEAVAANVQETVTVVRNKHAWPGC